MTPSADQITPEPCVSAKSPTRSFSADFAETHGSGVIWSADGVIVTNAHVVRASQMRIQLWTAASSTLPSSRATPAAI